jgi:hypothetical protein
VLQREQRRIWIGADGAGRLLESFGPPSFATPSDRATCKRMGAGAIPSAGVSDDWFAARCLSVGGPSQLPRGGFSDSATLLEEMRRIDGGPRTAGEDSSMSAISCARPMLRRRCGPRSTAPPPRSRASDCSARSRTSSAAAGSGSA